MRVDTIVLAALLCAAVALTTSTVRADDDNAVGCGPICPLTCYSHGSCVQAPSPHCVCTKAGWTGQCCNETVVDDDKDDDDKATGCGGCPIACNSRGSCVQSPTAHCICTKPGWTGKCCDQPVVDASATIDGDGTTEVTIAGGSCPPSAGCGPSCPATCWGYGSCIQTPTPHCSCAFSGLGPCCCPTPLQRGHFNIQTDGTDFQKFLVHKDHAAVKLAYDKLPHTDITGRSTVPVDKCPSSCSNHGFCTAALGVTFCSCFPGYTGESCGTRAEPFAKVFETLLLASTAAALGDETSETGLSETLMKNTEDADGEDEPCGLDEACSGHGACVNWHGFDACVCVPGWGDLECNVPSSEFAATYQYQDDIEDALKSGYRVAQLITNSAAEHPARSLPRGYRRRD